MAVADGAGSSRFGAHGARFAAAHAVRTAEATLDSVQFPAGLPASTFIRNVFLQTLERMRQVVNAFNERIAPCGTDIVNDPGAGLHEALAKLFTEPGSVHLDTADLHTTLLLAIITGSGLAAGNIGDGWLVVRREGQEPQCLACPAPPEQANETFFLDSPGALDDAVYDCVAADDIDALALMSDGAARFAVDLAKGTPSANLFKKLFAFGADSERARCEKEAELSEFLRSERVCTATDDDKTIVLAVKIAGREPTGT